ncbi:MAG: class I SAM-dependent methyltransferase [Anaerolineae bacterium]|nr:class I SAM-dependent methyltransferase [Anaerolineae bacterium]
MDHADHVSLLRKGIPNAGDGSPAPTWADFGAGWGAFTLALADLLGPGATVHAIDRDHRALARLENALTARFPETVLYLHAADFTRPLNLPPLDGLVMANALHFIPYAEQAAVVRRLRDTLKPGAPFLLVEYDTTRAVPWVPYPLAYPAWTALAARCGCTHTEQIHLRASRNMGSIYAARSL